MVFEGKSPGDPHRNLVGLSFGVMTWDVWSKTMVRVGVRAGMVWYGKAWHGMIGPGGWHQSMMKQSYAVLFCACTVYCQHGSHTCCM